MSNNFITNTGDSTTIKNRILNLMTKTSELKFLIGYFYFSGWQEIYNGISENKNIKLKILVGLQVEKFLSENIEFESKDSTLSNEEHFSRYMKSLGLAINNNEMDNEEFYNQLSFFVELLNTNRLEIKKTRNPNHAKLYLFKYNDELIKFDGNQGRLITGSSNLTKAGLQNQEEFNVEIRDYGFTDAEKYFDTLWENAVPITEAFNGKKTIINFLENKTIGSLITPYEAYAYILKTYLDLQETKKTNPFLDRILDKAGFDKYTYQKDAVNQALNIIEANNGVIIADVVGLGKSVIASLIASQLGKRGLILCPPGLIGSKQENSGWYEYINKFELSNWDIQSTGKIEEEAEAIRKKHYDYDVIIVDEAHRFRNQDTADYEALADICRGKKVILLTATPFNNSPADIFSLLKLFIIPGKSSITLENDIERKFASYNYSFKNLSLILKNYNSSNTEKKAKAEYLYTKIFEISPPVDVKIVKKAVSEMAREIKNTISPVIIRRNRIDLKNDFEYQKEISNLSKVKDPEELFYELSKEQSQFYDRIISNYFSYDGEFKGAIYKPNEYENKPQEKKDKSENLIFQQQRNLYDFMRRIIVKRFESSFGAFAKSIDRFLRVHKMVKSFIETSGKYILDRKVIDSIYNEGEDGEDFALEAIEKALEEFKRNAEFKTKPKLTKIYEVNDFLFKEKFYKDIESDIILFEKIKAEIIELNLINNDPKRETVLKEVKNVLSKEKKPKRKIIIFSEFTDTVKHLQDYFEGEMLGRAMFSSGNITKSFASELDENFNAKNTNQKDNFDIIVTSDKLSEGFNLNRAGLIINYDIPWNPTRVIQRVGRINRIGTKVFEELRIYNFFPTEQGSDIVKSREIASQKMFLIHNALGEDSKIFDTEEEPSASGLFNKINSNPDENEEISISTLIRNDFNKIKTEYPEVLKRISEIPNRTKTAKFYNENNTVVMRKKGMALFSIIHNYNSNPEEKTIEELIKFVKCEYEEKRLNLSKKFWSSYQTIKSFEPKHKTGKSSEQIKSKEEKAINSLKFILKNKRNDLNETISEFINTLLKDLKKYKTLSDFTIRKLIIEGENTEKNIEILLNNLEKLRQRIGNDYLEIILKNSYNIEDEIIIAVENIKAKNSIK